MKQSTVFLYSLRRDLLKRRWARASRTYADGNRENPFNRPLMKTIAKVLIPALGLVATALHLGCRTLSTSEDKTVEIVGALASLASEVPRFQAGTPTPTPTPPPFYFSFHPSNPKEVRDVKNALHTRGIYLDVRYAGQQIQTGGKEISLSRSVAHQIGEEGLIFRPGIPYMVELRYPDGSDFNTLETLINTKQQFILPDANRLYEIKYNRMAFVKKVKEIGFTDGMLTDFNQKVPSPILGFLGIPKAIVQAIVPIPAAPPSGSG